MTRKRQASYLGITLLALTIGLLLAFRQEEPSARVAAQELQCINQRNADCLYALAAGPSVENITKEQWRKVFDELISPRLPDLRNAKVSNENSKAVSSVIIRYLDGGTEKQLTIVAQNRKSGPSINLYELLTRVWQAHYSDGIPGDYLHCLYGSEKGVIADKERLTAIGIRGVPYEGHFNSWDESLKEIQRRIASRQPKTKGTQGSTLNPNSRP